MMYAGISARFQCICGLDNQMSGGDVSAQHIKSAGAADFSCPEDSIPEKNKPPNTIIITVFGGTYMNRYCKIRQSDHQKQREIRTHRQLALGSDFYCLVRVKGLEPSRSCPH